MGEEHEEGRITRKKVCEEGWRERSKTGLVALATTFPCELVSIINLVAPRIVPVILYVDGGGEVQVDGALCAFQQAGLKGFLSDHHHLVISVHIIATGSFTTSHRPIRYLLAGNGRRGGGTAAGGHR
jgi:hypothetical protein